MVNTLSFFADICDTRKCFKIVKAKPSEGASSPMGRIANAGGDCENAKGIAFDMVANTRRCLYDRRNDEGGCGG